VIVRASFPSVGSGLKLCEIGDLDFLSMNELVVFKDTESEIPRGHLKGATCSKPDITAAFQSTFNTGGVTSWPFIRMVGGWASEGESRKTQDRQSFSYLHDLLLARPDLYVAPAMLISETEIVFMVGIGGLGIRHLKRNGAATTSPSSCTPSSPASIHLAPCRFDLRHGPHR
jgi:hypothetical protein